MGWRQSAVVFTMLGCLGCANLDTVSRQTSLPGEGASSGVAIHLDAKQRLAFAKSFGAICAEPSPDAVSAFASSLGAGASLTDKGAASIAQAFTSTVGSIGLRTQSITLMRDTLYRICEAYYSRALTGPAVTTLLARAQDLTAAILAIEQLTGTVTANQVVLGGESSAAASSNLASIQSLLDGARENETAKNANLKELEADQRKKKTAFEEATKARSEKKSELDAAEKATPPKTQEQMQKLKDELKPLEDSTKAREADLTTAEARVKTAQALVEEAKKTREAIENNRGSALAQANATAAGRGSFGTPASNLKLDAQVADKVASAVASIVEKVTRKNYVVESCLALMTDNPPSQQHFKNAKGEIAIEDWKASFDAWTRAHVNCLAVISHIGKTAASGALSNN